MAWITVTSSNELDAQGIRDMVWSGAKDRVEDLTDDQLDIIISNLNDMYDGSIDEGELNDFLWFEDEIYAEWLGYKNTDDLWSGKSSDYYDATYGLRLSHGTEGIPEDSYIEDFLSDLEDTTGGSYEIFDDNETQNDDDTYSGYVDVNVSEAILDYLNDNGIAYEDI